MARSLPGWVPGLALFAALALVAPAPDAAPLSTEDALAERRLGAASAPVTMTEYSSLTCPHCATFHTETLRALKARYIDTGKLSLVFVDFPFDRLALAAGMIARCAGTGDRYFGVLHLMFERQSDWARSQDPVGELARIAQLGGLTRADVDACLADQALADGMIQARLAASEAHGINVTPSFVLNGGAARIDGAQPLSQFEAAIDRLLAAAGETVPAAEPDPAATVEPPPDPAAGEAASGEKSWIARMIDLFAH